MNIKNEESLNENIKNEDGLVELSSEELCLVAGGDCLVDPGSPCGYVSRKWYN